MITTTQSDNQWTFPHQVRLASLPGLSQQALIETLFFSEFVRDSETGVESETSRVIADYASQETEIHLVTSLALHEVLSVVFDCLCGSTQKNSKGFYK